MKRCVLVFFFVAGIAMASAGEDGEFESEDKTLSPYFVVKSDISGLEAFPLKSTSASVAIAGVIADVTVDQIYRNDGTRPIEAVYVFPASTRAAVYGMEMIIGDRRIVADIRKREQARKDYEKAKSDGKSASLLEEQRPNVFQMSVANILPGDTVTIQLKYTELLTQEDGMYEFVYPTVVGPRYSTKTEQTAATQDAFLKSPYTKAGEAPSYSFHIDVHLEAGMPIQDIASASHRIVVNRRRPAAARVSLDPGDSRSGNRDFILRYRLAGKEAASGLLLYKGPEENFFLLMVQPPARVRTDDIPPREYIFIVDVSGSMNGYPIDTSKKLLRNLLMSLRPRDRFNILFFAGGSFVLSPTSLLATPGNIETALKDLDRQKGGGGTEILPALKEALHLPRTDGMSRIVVIATDGYVAVEKETFDLIRENLGRANFFSFGIGTSVNRFLIEGMARAGRGVPSVVTRPEEADRQAERFRRYVQSPVLTDIGVSFEGLSVYDVEPPAIPDLFALRPIVIFGKWRGPVGGKITLRGRSGGTGYQETLNPERFRPRSRNAALRYLWARHKIATLTDYNSVDKNEARIQEVTRLGLKYRLLTEYTSFVAIDQKVRRTADGKLETVNQPLPMPEGVPNSAIGTTCAGSTGSGFFAGLGLTVVRGLQTPLVVKSHSAWPGLFSANAFRAWIERKLKSLESSLRGLFSIWGRRDPNAAEDRRESIAFTMEPDSPRERKFFQLAGIYFKADPRERTESVVTGMRTLKEVRDYLEAHPPGNGRPWGVIHLAVHSNEWTGIGVSVAGRRGERTTVESIRQAIRDGRFTPLSNTLVDSRTEIRIHGCGLGRNRDLLDWISIALGGFHDVERPCVRSSPHFVVFRNESEGATPLRVRKHDARAWYAFSPPNQAYSKKYLIDQFKNRYPAEPIDWSAALDRKTPERPDDVYCEKFLLPITWIETLPGRSSLPKNNSRLRRHLADLGIPFDAFVWRWKKTTHRWEDGVTEPALKVRGLAQVVCVLRLLPENGENGDGSNLTSLGSRE